LEAISTKLERIAKLAREAPDMAFTNLAHYIDMDWLHEAYRRTRKDAAAGIDGQTAEGYEQALESNLQSLLDRFKSGRYRAPPVRRVYIPKGDGKSQRPIGIPTLEDKILQRAVVMVLEAVYEQDFKDCSYGFRPGRSAHQALSALWEGLMEMRGGVVLEVDIKAYFDTIDKSVLRTFLDQRVRDGVLRRAIDKWLNAGVLEDGHITRPATGTPQGGVISPLLANIYLHEVVDRWFTEMLVPWLKGPATLVRYADDLVMVIANEHEARKVMDVFPKRFAKYGLTLHPTKTRLVPFRRPPWRQSGSRRSGTRPGTFDFLGLTHYWGRSRKGNWVVMRKTARSRFTRTVRSFNRWLRANRRQPVAAQHAALSRKLRGHDAYYGITGNHRALAALREQVRRLWYKWLNRRSQRRSMNWDQFNRRLLSRYPLPNARVVHSVYRRAANP
jgi:group II intron reverse transcriptase/maturase